MAKKKTPAGKAKAKAKRSAAARKKKASTSKRKAGVAASKAAGKKSSARKARSQKAGLKKDIKKKPAGKKKNAPKKKATAKGTAKKKATAKGTAKKKATAKRTAKKRAIAKRTAKKKVAAKGTAKKKATAKRNLKRKAAARKKVSTSSRKPVAKPAGRGQGGATQLEPMDRKKVVRAKGSRKKGAAAGREASPLVDEAPAESPMPKTRLSVDQLRMFKEILLDKRRALAGDVRTLSSDALGRSRQDSSGDLSSMPIHMADLGTDNWEQDFTLGLIANEQSLVREIDEALLRIENRTYGVCLSTRKPITLARLRAKPWAKYCIEHARARELGRH